MIGLSTGSWKKQRVYDPHTHLLDEYAMRHFQYDWNSTYPNLYATHSVEQYMMEQSSRVEVLGVQFMEITASPSDALAEAEHWQSMAKLDPRIAGVIASVVLRDGAATATEELEALKGRVPSCRGIRISKWGISDAFLAGFTKFAQYNLTFDVLVEGFGSTNTGGGNLTQAIELARLFPKVTFVLDHYGYPDIASPSGRDFERWGSSIDTLGSLPNVFAKISGGPMLAAGSNMSLSVSSFLPFTRRLLRSFGRSRVMYAGNWFWTNAFENTIPGVRPRGTLATWTDVVLNMTYELLFTDEERDALFFATARRVYDIGPLP